MKKVILALLLASSMGTKIEEIDKRLLKGFIKKGKQPIIEESLFCKKRIGIEKMNNHRSTQ